MSTDIEARLRELEKTYAVFESTQSLLIAQNGEKNMELKAALKEVVDHFNDEMEKLKSQVITKEGGGWVVEWGKEAIKYVVFAVLAVVVAFFLKK